MIKIKFSVPKEGESLKRKNTGDDSSSSKRQTYHHINDSMKALLKSLKSAKDPLSGRQLSYFFVELPNKEHYPDYYSLIKSPMSINMINRKLDRHEYHSFDDFKYDVNLIFSNARTYNMPESQVCNDANALEIKFKSEFDIAKRESSKENHFNSSSEQDVGRLHQWIIVNNPGNVLSMLSKGADPNEYYRDTQQSGINWNSLHVAAYYNSVEIAGILLDHGADIEAKDSKFLGTPLAWSCYRTNLEVCRLLIERGANKYARNALGQIPLDLLPVRTAEWLELFKEPEPIIKPIKLHLNTNQKPVIEEEEKSEKVVEEIKVLEKVLEAPVKRILRPPPPPVVEAPKKEQVVAVEIPKKQRVIESAPVEVPTVLSSDYPPLPKKRVEKETPILSCLGLVSNDHLLRTVLPPNVYSHSVMVDKKVKSLSLRVVLTTNTDAEKPKVSLMHNDQAVKCIEKVSAKGRLSVGAAHVIDFSTSVHQGLNIFEVFIGEEEEEMETYAIFIERPYL